MASEMLGLKFTDSSKVAFLENTAIVFVPIFEMFLKRRLPDKLSGFCSMMAIAGVGFITLNDGFASFGKGEGFSVLAALLYTCGIIVTDRLAKNDDALLIMAGVLLQSKNGKQ